MDRKFVGIRCTHQPSPWIGDYGNFIIQTGLGRDLVSGYSPEIPHSQFKPYYFQTDLFSFGTENGKASVELAASRHGAIYRARYSKKSNDGGFDQTRRIQVGVDLGAVNVTVDQDGKVWILGKSTKSSGQVPSNFAHYFVIGVYVGEKGNQVPRNISGYYGDSGNFGYIDFSADDRLNDLLTLRIATSFISHEQALLNLAQEVDVSKTFEQLVEESKNEWNQHLSKINIEDIGKGYTADAENDMRTVFYSSLYRSLLFPRQLSEIDANGTLVHWSPYDGAGKVYEGPISTDSGFWDAYISVYTLHSLISTEVLGPQMLSGWLNAFKEGGWIPKWGSPGYRSSMIGTMADITFADAIVKNIPGFDINLAYKAIRKDAYEVPPEGVDGIGRVCLKSYLDNGVILPFSPMTTGGNCYEIVSRSLNYMQSDWAIAQAAKFLGYQQDHDELFNRSRNYNLMFDQSTGFFRSKNISSNSFTEPFDQYAWGGDYTEGGPWQYRFYVPYDPLGLSNLYSVSGRSICTELQNTQTTNSAVHIGAYGNVIHEETELPAECWGQYAHNNQPSHHMLYMFQASDPHGFRGNCAQKGMYWLRRAMTKLYRPGLDMFSGDEDNGEMASWFVLSSLGLFALSPGSPDYNLGVPLYGKVQIQLGEGRTLLVIAENNGPDNFYVHSISFNNETLPLGASSISYDKLMQGGTLVFKMASTPLCRYIVGSQEKSKCFR
jgi:predicted alpha-1,2-mannosidase